MIPAFKRWKWIGLPLCKLLEIQLIMSPLKCEIQFDYDIHAFLNAGTNKSMEIERGRQITRKCFWDANCGKI